MTWRGYIFLKFDALIDEKEAGNMNERMWRSSVMPNRQTQFLCACVGREESDPIVANEAFAQTLSFQIFKIGDER